MNNTSPPFNLESSCNEAHLLSSSSLRALTCHEHCVGKCEAAGVRAGKTEYSSFEGVSHTNELSAAWRSENDGVT